MELQEVRVLLLPHGQRLSQWIHNKVLGLHWCLGRCTNIQDIMAPASLLPTRYHANVRVLSTLIQNIKLKEILKCVLAVKLSERNITTPPT